MIIDGGASGGGGKVPDHWVVTKDGTIIYPDEDDVIRVPIDELGWHVMIGGGGGRR